MQDRKFELHTKKRGMIYAWSGWNQGMRFLLHIVAGLIIPSVWFLCTSKLGVINEVSDLYALHHFSLLIKGVTRYSTVILCVNFLRWSWRKYPGFLIYDLCSRLWFSIYILVMWLHRYGRSLSVRIDPCILSFIEKSFISDPIVCIDLGDHLHFV